MAGAPDPKPEKRIRTPRYGLDAILTRPYCLIADATCEPVLSAHCFLPKGQGGDTVQANLVVLCGSGTTGHHGRIEAMDEDARRALGRAVLRSRQDTVEYVKVKLGETAGLDFLRRRYLIHP